MVWLTIGSYTARAAKLEGNYPPTQFVADYLFIAGVIYLLGFIYMQFFSEEPLPFEAILFVAIAGSFTAFAFLCLN